MLACMVVKTTLRVRASRRPCVCRMPELEMSAVESQTRGSHRTCSVELIPDHGMTALCQMDSNLVFPSRLKTNLDETCFRFAFQNTNVSDGELAGTAFGCGIDTISSVFVLSLIHISE